MKKIHVVLLFFVFYTLNLFSQNKIDSLQNLIKNTSSDSLKIEIYIDLTWEMMYLNPDSAIIFANKAIELSEDEDFTFQRANAFNALGTIYSIKTDFIKSMECERKAIEAIQILISKNTDNEQLMNKLGVFYFNLANAYYHSSLYEKAIEIYQQALTISEQTNFQNLQSSCYTSIGSTYNEMRMYDLSLKYYKKGLDFAENDSVPFLISQALNNLGNFYVDTDIDSAEFYYHQAECILKSNENYYFLIPTLINIIDIKLKKNQNDSADIYLAEVNELLQDIDYPEALVKYYNLKGTYYFHNENYDNALENYQKSLKLSQFYSLARYSLDNFIAMSDIYVLENNYKKAYEQFVSADAIEDSIYDIEKNKALAEMEIKFEVSKKEIEISQLKKDKIYNKKILNLLIGFVFILLLALGLGVFVFIQKQKNSRLKNQLIQKEKEKLDSELNYKSRQLTTQALIMMQKNKIMADLLKSLSQLAKKADDELKKDILSIKRRLKHNIKSEDDWNLFKHYFEDVNPTFFTKVIEVNDKISKSELKLCALIKLRFSIKETAEILNLSPDSVKTARYILRKKLNLESGQDISDFLNNL